MFISGRSSSGGIDKEGEDELGGNGEGRRPYSTSLTRDSEPGAGRRSDGAGTEGGLTRSRKGLTRSRRAERDGEDENIEMEK